MVELGLIIMEMVLQHIFNITLLPPLNVKEGFMGNYIASKITNVILNAGIPIDGVSSGKVDDKSTWRIDFRDEATEAQKVQAQKILVDFDESKIPDPVSDMVSRVEYNDLLDKYNKLAEFVKFST